MSKLRKPLTAGVVLVAAACSGPLPINSIEARPGTVLDGILYALPKSYLRVNREATGPEQVTVAVENKPDGRRQFQAQARFSSFSKDDFKIITNRKGLLDSVAITTEDVTPEITKTLTQGVSDVLAGRSGERVTGEKALPAYSMLVDPLAADVRGAGRRLPDDLVLRSFVDDPGLARSLGANPATSRCPQDATICVPVLIPLRLRLIREQDKGEEITIFEDVVTIAHPTQVMGIRLNRRPCVETISKIMLNDGVMTHFETKKPSEVVGCLSIPLDVISAIVAAPVNALTGRKARLEAEEKLLEQQADLLEAQQALINAQTGASGSE